MSGIVALFDRGAEGVAPATVDVMLDAIEHRGPDGRGCWTGDRVALGHQRLVTTPQAAEEDQPLRQGSIVVAADARLDNRPELASTLDLPGDPSTLPDSRYVATAYERWGAECVEHLVGAFAFVVWDAERERLLCARDHCGVTPLYCYRDEAVFAVASEKKALLALPTVDRDVDEAKIGAFLITAFEDRRRTYFEALDRLPPAHATAVTRDEERTWQYWRLDPSRTLSLGSDAAYERRFRDLFERAVQDRLRVAGPVGTSLSGGLDSSSITVVARDLLPSAEPLYAFSNVFDDAPSSDEREFIEPVVDADGIESEYVALDDVGVLVDREAVFERFDQPPHNTMHFGRWRRAERASDRGVSVLLNGALGDSAVGYGLWLLPHYLRTGRLWSLWRELRAMSDVADAPPGHLCKRHAVRPLVPDAVLRARRRRRGEPVLSASRNSTLDDEFAERVGLDDLWAEYSGGSSVLGYAPRREQYDSLTAGNAVASLETSDLVAAAHGVEFRYPFADPRLLEFTLAIPPSQQLKDGWTRSIVRRALDDLLPDVVQWRPWKTMLNEGFWNGIDEESTRLDRLVEAPGPLTRFLDPAALRRARDRFDADPTNRDARSLWRALSLAGWWARWVDATESGRQRPAVGDVVSLRRSGVQ